MANNLPPGVLPKLFRQRNKSGTEVGAWYIKISKKAVNLRTQDYSLARERAREAFFGGKRDFKDERFFETPSAGSDSVNAPESSEPAPAGGDSFASDVASAAASGLQPDLYTTNQGKETPLLGPIPSTEEPSPKPETPKVDEEGESTHIPPEMLESLIRQLAEMTVELQIQGQEWLAVKWGKFEPGAVQPGSFPRTAPAKLWESQFRKWLPSDVPIPEWVAAIALTAMLTVPVQLAGAKPIPKKDGAPAQAPQTE